MANREKGEVAFPVGDQIYTIKMTTDAMAQLEDACSTPEKFLAYPDILRLVLRGSAKYMILFLWAGLQAHHPTLTAKQVSKLIDQVGGITGLWDTLKSVEAADKPEADDAVDPPKAHPIPAAN